MSTVNASGNIGVGNHVISAGSPLAGSASPCGWTGRSRTSSPTAAPSVPVACLASQPARHRLRGARAGTAGPPQLPGPLTVRRRVSIRSAIMIGRQRIQVGLPHPGKTAEITIEADTDRITVQDGIAITAPRITSRDTKRHMASRYPDRGGHDTQH